MRDLSCARTNFSKHFMRMGVSATGRKSFRPAAAECLGTGTMAVVLKHVGTTGKGRDFASMARELSCVISCISFVSLFL